MASSSLEIAESGEPVLAPAVGARARVVVREVLPGAAGGAVVLAHRAPGALADVRTHSLPLARTACGGKRQPRVLGGAMRGCLFFTVASH